MVAYAFFRVLPIAEIRDAKQSCLCEQREK